MTGGAVVLTGAPSDTEETGDATADGGTDVTADGLGLTPGEQAAAMAITRHEPEEATETACWGPGRWHEAGW